MLNMVFNLNESLIKVENDGPCLGLKDWGVDQDGVKVHFRGLKDKLISYIDAADYVFGCVAWLTEPDILRALANKRGVVLVVQKEDFLRPDSPGDASFKKKLRDRYGAIQGVERYEFGRGRDGEGIAGELSMCGDPTCGPIRSMGLVKSGSFGPRMHHKFAVFAKENDSEDNGYRWSLPYMVWTGSFNWTLNAANSLENAVVFEDPKVAMAYYLEFQQILALSEPLDWTCSWVEPEWRIGT